MGRFVRELSMLMKAVAVCSAMEFALVTAPANAATLESDFSATGLSALKFENADVLASGGVELQDLKLDGGDVVGSEFSKTGETYDAAHHLLTQSYSWGKLTVRYTADASNSILHADLALSNTGAKSVTRFGIYLLKLQPPSPLKSEQWDGKGLLLHSRPDDFPLLTADYDTGRLAVCSDDVREPVTFGFQPLDNNAQAVVVRFDDSTPIKPGQSRKASLSIRFAEKGATTSSLVGDVLKAYASAHPSTLNWPDRRPIGSAFLATSARNYPTNPRGWFLDPNVDITTATGKAALAERVSKYVDSCIENCKKLDAQGVIVWDLEGQEMPHATSYLADPPMLPQVAPEMNDIADGLFAKFKKAGLRTGVTLRPTHVVKNDKGPGWMQQDVPDPIAELDEKITYAQKRWGCTLFYLDSNVTYVFDKDGKILDNPTMPAAGFALLARHHKGCLLMPEHKTAQYYASTAPYSEFRLGFNGTPEEVRIAYPHAFSVMQVVDGPNLAEPGPSATLKTAIQHGDILLFRPWWDDPQNVDIEHIYLSASTRLRRAGA